MEPKSQQSVERRSSILSPAQRSILVWTLGKLSLLLGLALLALLVLFSLELLAAKSNTEGGPDFPAVESLTVPASLEGERGDDDLLSGDAGAAAGKKGLSEPEPALTRSDGSLGDTGSRGPGIGPLRGGWEKLDATLAPEPGAQLAASPTRAAPLPPATVSAPRILNTEALVEDAGAPTTQPVTLAVTSQAQPALTPDASQPAIAATGDVEATDGADLAVVQPTSTPAALALDEPNPPDPNARPVQIRIPAIKVKRSIIELPEIRDPATGAWTQDLGVLFRNGRKDLVGHYARSAQPGQQGNMILAGHNYGYGTRGVFLKLGRLKVGEEIYIVNVAGKSFTYRVTAVEKVPWRSKDTGELLQHARLLMPSGEERLTLVTCGGSRIQPFPARIYVVAEPVGD